jgi:large subunit ribosomal protein L49
MPIQRLLRQTAHTLRSFSQLVASRDSTLKHEEFVRHPYFVPRNTRGSLPVYTDVRNGGTRYLMLIRNIDGDANVSH